MDLLNLDLWRYLSKFLPNSELSIIQAASRAHHDLLWGGVIDHLFFTVHKGMKLEPYVSKIRTPLATTVHFGVSMATHEDIHHLSFAPLNQLTHLISLSIARFPITPTNLHEICSFTGLTNLYLSFYVEREDQQSSQKDSWACFSSLTNLAELTLSSRSISDEELVAFRNITTLQSLTLQLPFVSYDGLQNFSKSTKLRQLSLQISERLDADTSVPPSPLGFFSSVGESLEDLLWDSASDKKAFLVFEHLYNLLSFTALFCPLDGSCLTPLTKLETLNIYHAINPVSLSSIGVLTNLASLEIEGCQQMSEGASAIAQLTNLTHLKLCGTDLDNESVENIRPLTKLKRLTLSNCPASDDSLHWISTHTNLEFLDISTGTCWTLHSVSSIGRLTNLTDLFLPNCQISNTAGLLLGDLGSLMTLDLQSNLLSSVGASSFRHMTNLTFLDISFNKIGDKGLEILCDHCTQLAILDLTQTKTTEQFGLTKLGKLVNLHTLTFLKNTPHPDLDLTEDFTKAFERLKNLDTLCIQLRDRDVAALRHNHLLRHLELDQSFTGEGLVHLSCLQLRTLTLWECGHLTKSELCHLPLLTTLRKLSVPIFSPEHFSKCTSLKLLTTAGPHDQVKDWSSRTGIGVAFSEHNSDEYLDEESWDWPRGDRDVSTSPDYYF